MICCIFGSFDASCMFFMYSSMLGVSCSHTSVQNCSPVTSVITRGAGAPAAFISGSIDLNFFSSVPTLPGLQYMTSRMRYMRPPSVASRNLGVNCDLHRAAIRIRHRAAALGERRDLLELRRVGALQSVRGDLEMRRLNLDPGVALVGGHRGAYQRPID